VKEIWGKWTDRQTYGQTDTTRYRIALQQKMKTRKCVFTLVKVDKHIKKWFEKLIKKTTRAVNRVALQLKRQTYPACLCSNLQ
jgi:hypothetical protein